MLSLNKYAWVYKAKFWTLQSGPRKGVKRWHNPKTNRVEDFHEQHPDAGEGPHEEVAEAEESISEATTSSVPDKKPLEHQEQRKEKKPKKSSVLATASRLADYLKESPVSAVSAKMVEHIMQPVHDYYSKGEKPKDTVFKTKTDNPDLNDYEINVSYFPVNSGPRVHTASEDFMQLRFPSREKVGGEYGDVERIAHVLQNDVAQVVEHEMGHHYLQKKTGREDLLYYKDPKGFAKYFYEPEEIVLHSKSLFDSLKKRGSISNQKSSASIESAVRNEVRMLPNTTGTIALGAKMPKALADVYWKHINEQYVQPFLAAEQLKG
jgi:hypothetical protein